MIPKEYIKDQSTQMVDMLKPKNSKHISLLCLNLVFIVLSFIGILTSWTLGKVIALIYISFCGIALFAGIVNLE